MILINKKNFFSLLLVFNFLAPASLALSDTPPLDPPAGIGLFIHNSDTDITSANNDDKTQITLQHPLDPNTNWYIYPDVMTLKCNSSMPMIDYGSYQNNSDQLWKDLNTYYRNKWQSNMGGKYHIYMMPQLTIDPSCKNLDLTLQPMTAIMIANVINPAPIDGIEIHLDHTIISQNIINIITMLSTQLNADKRIAIDSETNDMDKNPNKLTSLSYWPALNRTSGCDRDPKSKANCIKGFAIPTIYNDVDTAQSPDGSVGDFYQQMSYLVSEGFNTIAGWLGGTNTSTTAGDNYFIQPALPGASSINNAASYLSSDNPQPAVNNNQQWGTDYSADTGSQYGWTQTGLSTASSGHYSLINQYYPLKGDNRKQVYACHYLCSGLGTYSIIEQILAQTGINQLDYTKLDLWKNISHNLSNLCGIDTAFNQNTHNDQGKEAGLPLQTTWMENIAKHDLQGHLIGSALYQLNYSPVMDGNATDPMVNQCAQNGCTKLNPYPNTISTTSWTMLINWLTQKDSAGHGWLSNQALSDDDSKKFASMINGKLSCPAPTPGKESIDWPSKDFAVVVPNGVNSNNTITGVTLDRTATLNNPHIGDRLHYSCGIYASEGGTRVPNTTCTINQSDKQPVALSISSSALMPSNSYSIYISVTSNRDGVTVPDSEVPWVRIWYPIPAATNDESIHWDNASDQVFIPTTHTGTSLTGSIIENAILLKPSSGDTIYYSCGVYDHALKPVKGASCSISQSTNQKHDVKLTGLTSAQTPLKIHFSATVVRNGAIVQPSIIPWVTFNKDIQ